MSTFVVDAVLFDMDGTLTDSIQAVEAAWGKVAKDIGQDPKHVIEATHGKRAVDNLRQFKPHISMEQMDAAVQEFEESILYFADAYQKSGPPSRRSSVVSSRRPSMAMSNGEETPELMNAGMDSASSSRTSSMSSTSNSFSGRRPSFGTRLGNALAMSTVPEDSTSPSIANYADTFDDEDDEADEEELQKEWQNWASEKVKKNEWLAWQMEAAAIDRGVQILPGVKRMINSLPQGRYAVATSGAKTYAFGCMTRVGIVPPEVTITADDKRLKNGKPFPDPFLLAAECLGYDAKNCVVFEDSPSGIKAGVASGATVIAVCTSHERKAIENCGAHFIVDNMEKVETRVLSDGRIQFFVDVDKPMHTEYYDTL